MIQKYGNFEDTTCIEKYYKSQKIETSFQLIHVYHKTQNLSQVTYQTLCLALTTVPFMVFPRSL